MKLNELVKKPVELGIVQLATGAFSVTFTVWVGPLMLLSGFRNVPFAGWFWFLLGLLGLLLTAALCSNRAFMWYAANLYWISFFLFFVYLGITKDSAFGNTWGRTWYIIFPLVYSFGCTLYFQTRRIKQYFSVIRMSIRS